MFGLSQTMKQWTSNSFHFFSSAQKNCAGSIAWVKYIKFGLKRWSFYSFFSFLYCLSIISVYAILIKRENFMYTPQILLNYVLSSLNFEIKYPL